MTPGYTDGELWRGSNGPIFVADSFVTYVAMMREVLALGTLLARVADPDLAIGRGLLALLTDEEGEEWVPGLRRGLQSLGVELGSSAE